MTTTVFADGIGEISVAGGVVRIEWITQHMKGEKELERQTSCVIAIPIQGFANAVPPLKQLLDKMVKEGVVKARTAPGMGGPRSSPNFQ